MKKTDRIYGALYWAILTRKDEFSVRDLVKDLGMSIESARTQVHALHQQHRIVRTFHATKGNQPSRYVVAPNQTTILRTNRGVARPKNPQPPVEEAKTLVES